MNISNDSSGSGPSLMTDCALISLAETLRLEGAALPRILLPKPQAVQRNGQPESNLTREEFSSFPYCTVPMLIRLYKQNGFSFFFFLTLWRTIDILKKHHSLGLICQLPLFSANSMSRTVPSSFVLVPSDLGTLSWMKETRKPAFQV